MPYCLDTPEALKMHLLVFCSPCSFLRVRPERCKQRWGQLGPQEVFFHPLLSVFPDLTNEE